MNDVYLHDIFVFLAIIILRVGNQRARSSNSKYIKTVYLSIFIYTKDMTNVGSVLKSREIIFSTEIPMFKVMIFPIVMDRCESWTIKKTEHQKIDAFELWG